MSCKIIENSSFNYIHTQNTQKSSRIASYGHIEGALDTVSIQSVHLVAYRTSFLWTLYTHTSAVWCHMAYQAVQNFLAESIRLSRANPKPKYELPEQPIQKASEHGQGYETPPANPKPIVSPWFNFVREEVMMALQLNGRSY